MKHFKNNGKLKLMIIVGTRPEIIRLSCVINKCRQNFDTLLVHTGQNYDYNLNEIFFKELKIESPDIYLDVSKDNLGSSIGDIVSKSYDVMKEVRPDAILILGDTNSCLSSICAKRLHIPIFHMEAGNRCNDECLPEETNRKIVDIISDINIAYSEHARRNLLHNGLPNERVFVSGSPMYEVLNQNIEKIKNSNILEKLNLQKNEYILLSLHREENLDDDNNFISLFNSLNELAKRFDMPILYSCHPRSKKRIEKMNFKLDDRIIQHQPLGFIDYNNLQMNSFLVISDSGTLPEESHFYYSIGCPIGAISIRTSTERNEAMEKGCFVLGGIDEKNLFQAVDIALNNKNGCSIVEDYNCLNVSDKIVKLVQSYTNVINKFTYHK